jgi:hypothetical protein
MKTQWLNYELPKEL